MHLLNFFNIFNIVLHLDSSFPLVFLAYKPIVGLLKLDGSNFLLTFLFIKKFVFSQGCIKTFLEYCHMAKLSGLIFATRGVQVAGRHFLAQ